MSHCVLMSVVICIMATNMHRNVYDLPNQYRTRQVANCTKKTCHLLGI